MKTYLETKLTNLVTAYTINYSYQGPREFTFKTDCLMEFGLLDPYISINLCKKKLENPMDFDPDFMIFLSSVKSVGDHYEVTYLVDHTLNSWND